MACCASPRRGTTERFLTPALASVRALPQPAVVTPEGALQPPEVRSAVSARALAVRIDRCEVLGGLVNEYQAAA
jgi:hypothetical protein